MNIVNNNILTIDLEDFLSLPAFKKIETDLDWNLIINRQVDLVLDALFQANDTKATFFVVGEIAKRNPSLINKIAIKGHHIGSHSNTHRPICNLSQCEFEFELSESVKNIKKATGKQLNCYRAPIWSYNKEMDWFWEVLKNNNILFDSSIFPISKFLFGDPKANRFINKKQLDIIELPPTTIRVFGLNFPVSGGVYFRILPYFLIRYLLKRSIKKNAHPLIMYFHPWELDSSLVKVNGVSMFYKFILYYNTKKSHWKFSKLINDFKFTSIETYIAENKI